MDLKSPGVEVRPIRQITGDSEFNEVFMHEVRVPVTNRLGAEGQGWEIVTSALINERTGIAGSIRTDQALERLIGLARERRLTADPIWRQRLSDLAIRRADHQGVGPARDDRRPARAHEPAPLGRHEAALDRADATLLRGRHRPARRRRRLCGTSDAPGAGRWAYQFLYDRSMTIAGGTSEVQRNIVAQRVLGLPRS